MIKKPISLKAGVLSPKTNSVPAVLGVFVEFPGVLVLRVKFCTDCYLLIFLTVFYQAEVQRRSLFITNADIKKDIVSLSKYLLTL